MASMNCMDCNAIFEFQPNPQFPRKYCDNCSKKRKEAWKNKLAMPSQPEPVQKTIPKKPEFHAAEENIRIGALKCAISFAKLDMDLAKVGVIELARQFETYLRNG